MNLRQTVTALLMSLLTAAGLCSCGSSNGSHLLYVTTGQGIYGFRINNSSGASTPLSSPPFVIGNAPAGIVLSPSGQLAFVANEDDNTISLLKVDPVSGNLSEVLPRTASGGFSPNQLAMDPAGSTLFVANQLSNNVTAFSVSSSGALSLVSTAPVGSQPSGLAFANGLLFVAVPNFSRVYVFSANSGTLTAVNGSPFLVSDGVASVTVDSSAKFLYVPNAVTNTISAFSVQFTASSNTMTLIAAPGSPFAPTTTATIPVAPVAAVLDAAATHLYVANFGSSSVSQFAVGTDGSLSSLTPATVTVGTNPAFLVFDPNQKQVFVNNVGSRTITELPINSDATLGSTSTTINVPSVPQALALTK
jgi:DNA-binding beta-propeller fold protein YncE